MAFTRKWLSALGIEQDKVDEIISAHTEVTDALKEQRDGYKADAEKLEAVQKELDELKASAAEDGKSSWKVKYDAIKEEFETYKTEQTAKETKTAKETAYKALLKQAGVSEKRIDAVLKVTDLDGVELDKDGAIKGADKHLESIKSEWADFIPTTSTVGASTANPPTNAGSKSYKTKDEIYAIRDTAERQKAILENHELFGI